MVCLDGPTSRSPSVARSEAIYNAVDCRHARLKQQTHARYRNNRTPDARQNASAPKHKTTKSARLTTLSPKRTRHVRALPWSGVHEALFIPKAVNSARVQSAVARICSEEQSGACTSWLR